MMAACQASGISEERPIRTASDAMVVRSTPTRASQIEFSTAPVLGRQIRTLRCSLSSASFLLGRSSTSAEIVLFGHGSGESSDIILKEPVLAFKFVVVLFHLIDFLGQRGER